MGPDGGWGWVVVLVTFLYHFLGGFFYAMQSVLYLALQDQFQEGKGKTSWILALYTTLSTLTGPVSAILGAKYGYRAVTFTGGLLMGLGSFVSFFANSIGLLILTLGVVAGVGNGFCYVSCLAMCSLYFNKRRSLAIGLGTSGVGLGAFVLPPLVSWLEGEFSWRGMLLIVSGCLFNVCVIALLLRPLKVVKQELDVSVNEKQEDDDVDEKCEFVMRKDVSDYSVMAVEEIDVPENKSLLEVVGNDDRIGNGTQSLSNMTIEVTPSPTEIPEVKATSPSRGQLNMVSEIMRRNKDLIIDSDRGRSLSFNHNTSISSENVHIKQDKPLFCSVQDIHRRHHSNQDLIRGSQNHGPADGQGKSLTNLSIMLMGSAYNIIVHDTTLNSMLSLTSKKSASGKETHYVKDVKDLPASNSNRGSNETCCKRFLETVRIYKDLMTDWKCLLLLITNFLVNLTYLSPILYLVDRAVEENNIEKNSAILALSLYGAGNTFGRIFSGVIGGLACVNRTVFYFICLLLCGLSTGLSVFCGPYLFLHATFGCAFGILIGGYVTLTPVVLVDVLGVEVVGQSLGLCLFFQGASTMVGAPMAGMIFDMTGSYTIPFILYGSFLVLSSLLLVPIIYMQLRGDNNKRAKN